MRCQTPLLKALVTAAGLAACGGLDIPPPYREPPPIVTQRDSGPDDVATFMSPDAVPLRPPMTMCGGTAVSLTRRRATVMLVIDRSGSMADPTTDAAMTSRWTALLAALRSALPRVDEALSLGLVLFPQPLSLPEGQVATEADVCAVARQPQVVPAPRNARTVLDAISATLPGGATPTAAGVETGAEWLLRAPDRDGELYLLLATDGGPNCNAIFDPQTCRCTGPAERLCRMNNFGRINCLDQERTVASVRRVAEMGVQTFVLGLNGTQDFADVLDAMAVAGGRARPMAPMGQRFYPVGSADELVQALTGITSALAQCRFVLDAPPPDHNLVDLRLDGRSIVHDPQRRDGWDWSDGEHRVIEFFGPTCETVRQASGGSSLAAAFGCPAPAPP